MAERPADKLPSGVLRLFGGGEDLADLALGELVREPVAAQEETAPRFRFEIPDVEVDLGVDPERPRENVTVRVDGRLVGRQLALANHLLHDGVVLG